MEIEVRKVGQNQFSEGHKVTFLIHFDEQPTELILAPIGQPYKMELTKLDYDNPREEPQVKKPQQDKVLAYACILSTDQQFWSFAKVDNEVSAREFICKECGVEERKQISKNEDSAMKFKKMVNEFEGYKKTGFRKWDLKV